MNRIHPSTTRAILSILAAALSAVGCRSSSSGSVNPFLAPDRVPPPSTRAIAPGQAVPYYQGDPLPVMQSAAPPVGTPSLAGDAAARSSTGKALAWNAPTGDSPARNAATATSAPVSPWEPKITPPIASVREPAIVVPQDAASLRFAPPVSATVTSNATTAATPPAGSPGAAPNVAAGEGVQLASFTTPAPPGLNPVVTTSLPSPTPQESPWRSPGALGRAMPAAAALQPTPLAATAPQYSPSIPPLPYAGAQTLPVVPTNPMPVQLRAVPAPPPQPGDPLPRVRFPGYMVPQTATTDGFRPRSSMR